MQWHPILPLHAVPGAGDRTRGICLDCGSVLLCFEFFGIGHCDDTFHDDDFDVNDPWFFFRGEDLFVAALLARLPHTKCGTNAKKDCDTRG